MNKNIVMLALIAAGVFMLSNKANAGTKAVPKASAPIDNKNVTSDLWARLLGDGWRNLITAQNADGTAAFLKKNLFGQVVTSDGTPVSSGDAVNDYLQSNLGYTDAQASAGQNGFFATEAMTGKDYTDPMDGFRNPNDYFNNPDLQSAF